VIHALFIGTAQWHSLAVLFIGTVYWYCLVAVSNSLFVFIYSIYLQHLSTVSIY